jgi:hypothetical protein
MLSRRLFADGHLAENSFDDVVGFYVVCFGFVVQQNAVVHYIQCHFMVVIKKKSETKRSFTSIITVVRLHIMSYVKLIDFLKDTYKAWRSSHSPPSNSKMGIPLSLGFN